MKYRKARDTRGAVVTPPKPHGISGGGLWIMPNSFKPKDIYLTAIAIEYYERVGIMFSTKVKKVIEFIERYA